MVDIGDAGIDLSLCSVDIMPICMRIYMMKTAE